MRHPPVARAEIGQVEITLAGHVGDLQGRVVTTPGRVAAVGRTVEPSPVKDWSGTLEPTRSALTNGWNAVGGEPLCKSWSREI